VPATDLPPGHRDYEISVVRRGGTEYPDPASTRWPGFASIPLPIGASLPHRNLAIVRGPATPPNAEDATSYTEHWAAFATGRTVPDSFTRLFQAIGTAFNPFHARDAVLGYGLVRRISLLHTGTLDRNAINAFLVTLATFDRTLRLTSSRDSLWERMLAREPNRPFNNWGELHRFQNLETYPREDFGLTFQPPADPSHPWEITTRWRRDDFMQVLLAIRPTLHELRQIIAYADIFIRTRPAACPLSGNSFPNEPAR
jgi:hypothetical protein